MAGTPLLRTERLTRSYGSLLALDRVSIAVNEGELRSIIGPNGAGKTTLFRGERERRTLPSRTTSSTWRRFCPSLPERPSRVSIMVGLRVKGGRGPWR